MHQFALRHHTHYTNLDIISITVPHLTFCLLKIIHILPYFTSSYLHQISVISGGAELHQNLRKLQKIEIETNCRKVQNILSIKEILPPKNAKMGQELNLRQNNVCFKHQIYPRPVKFPAALLVTLNILCRLPPRMTVRRGALPKEGISQSTRQRCQRWIYPKIVEFV